MKIIDIRIKNFRNIELLEILGIKQSVALFGLVGQGKTSVLEAIRVALLGECELSGELKKHGGAGMGGLVLDGAKEATIKVTVNIEGMGDLTAEVTIPKKGKAEWMCYEPGGEVDTTTPKTIEGLWELSNTPFDHARVAMQPSRFLLSTELGDILAVFLSASIEPEQLRELAGEHQDWLLAYATDHKETLDSVASFEALGDHAYKWRTQVKRNIKEFEASIEALGFTRAPKDANDMPMNTGQLEKLLPGIVKAEAGFAELLVEKGRAEAFEGEETIGDRRTKLKSEHAELCQARDTFGIRMQKAENALDGARGLRDVGQTNHAGAVQILKGAQDELKQLKKRRDSLMAEGGVCENCGHKYTDDDRDRDLDPIKLGIDIVAETVQAHEKGVNARLADLKPLHEAVKAATDITDKVLGEKNLNQNDIAAVTRALDELPEPETVRELSVIEEEIEALEAKIARGRESMGLLNKMKEKEDAETGLKLANVELDHLKWTIDAFKDGTAIKKLISGGLDEFTSRCNSELEQFGYKLDIETGGKKLGIRLRCPGYGFRSVALCSLGQQHLAQVAIAFAFADTGAPVLLDNLNAQDGVFRTVILRHIQAEANLTVVTAGAWQQRDTSMEKISAALKPMRVVWIEDGMAKEKFYG